MNDGEQPTTWLARAALLKAKHNNGNGAGMPLSIAAGLWRTPEAATKDHGVRTSEGIAAGRQISLQTQAVVWSTPGIPSNGGRKLSATQLQTGKSARTGVKLQRHLESQAALWASTHLDPTTVTDGSPSSQPPRDLNPLFVEWLMGWPEGWTDPLHAVTGCISPATALCPAPRRSRSSHSRNDSDSEATP